MNLKRFSSGATKGSITKQIEDTVKKLKAIDNNPPNNSVKNASIT